jgi:uncharacterized protein Yka (UPF0111/DUF47 family)
MATKKNDIDYFEYFCTSARYAGRAAAYLDEILNGFSKESFPKQVDEMHSIENAADATRHEMIEKLAKEFIPPIEREDIVALSQELDNVVDTLDEVVQYMYMFDVSEIRADALDFSKLIIRCCDALGEAVSEFRRFRKSKTLHDMLITVRTLESDGDALLSQSVRRLFLEEADAKTTMVWMRLFDCFENCLDACEDAVDIIESVVLKNS